jgi:CRP/FNR family cyclic AMP-dependent transcriptional regulator
VPRNDYHDHLARVPIFASCSAKQLDQIAGVTVELAIERGQVLTQQGSVGSELFIILDGQATVSHDDNLIATVGPGDFAGEMAVLSNEPRNASVVAETNMTVLVLTRAGFSQLLDDVPGLAKSLLYEVAARFTANSDLP